MVLRDVTRTKHRPHIHAEDSLLVLLRLPLGTKMISESLRRPFRLRTDFFPSDSIVPTCNERNKVSIAYCLFITNVLLLLMILKTITFVFLLVFLCFIFLVILIGVVIRSCSLL